MKQASWPTSGAARRAVCAWVTGLVVLTGVVSICSAQSSQPGEKPAAKSTKPKSSNKRSTSSKPAAKVSEKASKEGDANWHPFSERYLEEYFAAHPSFAARQGRHENDGALPDWSEAGLASQIAWFKAQRTAALQFKVVNLSAAQRFERDYMLAQIDNQLFWLRDLDEPHRNPAFYIDSLDPSVYLTRPYAAPEVRMKAFTRYLQQVPTAAAQIHANLRQPLPGTYIDLARASFNGYAAFFRKEALQVFTGVEKPELQSELLAAAKSAADSSEALAQWFKSLKPGPTDSFAIGRKQFESMLWNTERVRVSLADLEARGQADLDRNLAALRDACENSLPGESLHACVDKMNADKAGGGAVDGARAQLADLRQFILDKQLVSIPGAELALVNEAPVYQRWNFAYIDIAGPYDKGMPSTYYIAPPDAAWPQPEQDAYTPGRAALLFTSAHEVWPGHFLQFLHSNRSNFRFGQVFVGYAFAEGWAHYSEEMMWDAGLGKQDAQTHVGQLVEALLRNVRFMCAIGLHTKGMSLQECETMFREQGFQDAANARQQAARGTFDPAYLNYTMGKLMIRQLRDDWMRQHRGATLKEFNDKFLSFGGPPIALVREQMMGSTSVGR
jgi:hypothetical protein